MEITVRRCSDVQIIQLRGTVRLGQAVDTFRRAIEDAFSAGDVRLILNCAEMPMIDYSGIGVIVKSMSSAKQRGGDLRLVNPSTFVTRTLRLIGVLNLFTTFDDEDQAVESYRSQQRAQ
ncbi:MAG: STAS domain-containing protein [Terriglobales bacterium]|jgi:anti-sigma B factor antagonist